MGFDYFHLGDPEVRQAMLRSWASERDDLIANWSRDACYGKQLTDAGWAAFDQHMPEALRDRDDDWIHSQMSPSDYWDRFLTRGSAQVDYNKAEALDKLAYGEFNIAYIRGLAQVLLDRGESRCVVYRADAAYEPRGECSGWENREFDLSAVATGHRVRYFPPPGDRTVWSVPSGPNCHHSIRALVVP